jgi:hypothetical protein
MVIITWVKRLLGLATVGSNGPVPTGSSPGRSRPPLTAADVGLLGLATAKSNGPVLTGSGPGRSRPPLTAADVGRRVQELQKANAQWPEIWHALNPDEDAEAQQLLIEFRGPYLFAPHVALNVLQEGCRRALAHSPGADRAAALRAALQSDDRIVRR